MLRAPVFALEKSQLHVTLKPTRIIPACTGQKFFSLEAKGGVDLTVEVVGD